VASTKGRLTILLLALCRLEAVESRRETVQQSFLLQTTLSLHHDINATPLDTALRLIFLL